MVLPMVFLTDSNGDSEDRFLSCEYQILPTPSSTDFLFGHRGHIVARGNGHRSRMPIDYGQPQSSPDG